MTTLEEQYRVEGQKHQHQRIDSAQVDMRNRHLPCIRCYEGNVKGNDASVLYSKNNKQKQ